MDNAGIIVDRRTDKPGICLLGKLPPPYMGPAIATRHVLDSSLKERFRLLHVNTTAHESLHAMGSWSLAKVWQLLRICGRLLGVLVRDRPRIVVIPISQATLGFLKDSVFILLSRMLRRPTLVHLRGSNLHNWLASSTWITRAYVEAVLRTAQGAIVLGSNLRHLFEPYYPAHRIFVVPNGGDYAIPKPPERRGDMSVRVLYLANLQPSKGIEDVIRGVRILKDRGLDGFTLDVIGAWRDEETKVRCLSLCAQHRLPVTFCGPVYETEKFIFLGAADVFVFPPRKPEGHPWVIVEAMAAGLPIIATDQGAIRESVIDGENGYLVDAERPDHIADALQTLIVDRLLRKRMGDSSRTRYEQAFTSEHMAARLGEAIETMLTPAR